MFTLLFKRMTSKSVHMTHKKIEVGYSGSGVLVDGYEAPNVGVGTRTQI